MVLHFTAGSASTNTQSLGRDTALLSCVQRLSVFEQDLSGRAASELARRTADDTSSAKSAHSIPSS